MVSPSTPPAGDDAAASATASIRDVVIRLAGNSQDGIQAIGGFLARLAGRSDQEVMTYMTIPSTISGGPSIFQVRMGSGEILSAGDRADVLIAFYQHSYQDHRASLRPGGVLIYDSDHVTPNPDDKEVTAVGVPITSATVEAVGGATKEKGKNIYVLGFLARMFDLDVPKLTQLIKERFTGKNEGHRAANASSSVLRSRRLRLPGGAPSPLSLSPREGRCPGRRCAPAGYR